MNDPINTLEDILKRNGHELDLRDSDKEENRYFLFDQISDPNDLDLAWSQFPAHQEIRSRAEEIDATSDIVAGWGYRVPKKSKRCSDTELVALVRSHIAASRSFITESWDDVAAFIDDGYNVQIVTSEAPSDPMENTLFMALYESMGDFKNGHFPYDQPLLDILNDWAIYLTKCDEVALYLLWPVLESVESIDPTTPAPGFSLWRYNCRTNYWIKDDDLKSGLVCVQRPWA